MRPVPAFLIGDHVKILPLEEVPARVIELVLADDGWTVVCRYFQNGEAKTAKLFPDEVEPA